MNHPKFSAYTVVSNFGGPLAHAVTQALGRPAVRRFIALSATCAAALAALTPSLAQAPGDLRVALVIGNAAYAGSAALANPGNDAKAMSDALRGLGFTVVEIRDGSKTQMQDAISKVKTSLQGKQAIGMLYYAGHGLQLDWRNYMVPIDAKMSKAADVPEQAVDLAQVIDAFKTAGNRMNIVVLDACRDNPFAGTATGKGLAQLDAPPGTFLAYATAPGNVAEDGDAKSNNGLYTKFLLEELKKPTAKIEDVFKRVRLNVRQQSQGRQIPWESTSLEDDFFFNAGLKPTQKLSDSDKDKAFTAEKTDWDKIKDSKNADDFYAFVKQYPSGNISELAQSRIELLAVAKIAPQLDKDGKKQSAFLQRYQDGDTQEFVLKDGLTGVETGRSSVTIRRIGDNLLEGVATGMAGVTVDGSGFVSKDGGGTYDPPWSAVPGGELQVGKKWNGRSIQTRPEGTKQWVDIDAKVLARERVTVPLGTFDTYRVELNFVYQSGARSKITIWYDPDWGYAPKLVRQSRSAKGTPDVFVREMTARSRKAS